MVSKKRQHTSLFFRRQQYRYRVFCRRIWTHFLAHSPNFWAIKVSYSQYREKLDTYLKRYWTEKTKHEIRIHIHRGQIRVNFLRVKPDYRVRKGDMIMLSSNSISPIQLLPIETPLTLLYKDRYCVIVNKPVGLVVHHHFDRYQPSVITELFRRGFLLLPPYCDMESNVVHRLDKYTSGALLVCRRFDDIDRFKDLFHKRNIFKEYQAIVQGNITTKHGIIDAPIRKNERVYPSRMVIDHSYHRGAITEYEVIKSDGEYTHCSIHLMTGRTHQIRVHFASIGHPIIGDLKYNSNSPPEHVFIENQADQPRMMLHASRLQFKHPFTGQLVDVNVPLPKEFVRFFRHRSAYWKNM